MSHQNTTLKDHIQLCEEVYALLLEENKRLKENPQSIDSDFLTQKEALLPKLDTSLAALKQLNQDTASPLDSQKIETAQKKLMQIFYLSRENEQLLMKSAIPSTVHNAVAQQNVALDKLKSTYASVQ